MPLHDHHQDLSRTGKRVYIPVSNFVGFAEIVSAGTRLESQGAGVPALQEVNTTGVGALKIDATGDDVHHFMEIPYDLDTGFPLEFAAVWSSDQTTITDTATWLVLFNQMTPNASSGIAAAATALDTVIAADTNIATADGIQTTAFGQINGNTFANDDFIHFLVELDAVVGTDPAADDVNLYGVLLRYTVRFVN